jgi:hypothetical protein
MGDKFRKKQQSADPLVSPSAAFQRRKLKHLKPQFNLLFYFGGKADRPVADSGVLKKRGRWEEYGSNRTEPTGARNNTHTGATSLQSPTNIKAIKS